MKVLRGAAVAAATIIIVGLAGCGDDAGSGAEAQPTVTVTVTATVTPDGAPMEGAGESATATGDFGTIQELGEAVCDPGTFKDTGDDYDFPCEVDGHRVLLTDWSTFGGAPEEGPGKMSVNDVFGIQGPPAAIEAARERLGN
jgi:hypothetical protein